MPTTIPYDHSSLVLGNIVDTKVLDLLSEMGKKQNTIDVAQDKLTSFLMMKRSLAMTINELIDMNIDVGDVKNKLAQLDTSISKSAIDYMSVRLKAEEDIQQLRIKLTQLNIGNNFESPINFSDSQLKHLPLSSDSLKLDSQYFSFGSNLEEDGLSKIEKYIKESTSDLGGRSVELAKSATSQIKNQHQNHNLAGTLIITACCTHKLVSLYDPLVLDVDKAIAAWNTINPSSVIDTSSPEKVRQFATKGDGTSKDSMSLLSGASYGSSFIGMVHMLNSEGTTTGNVDNLVGQLQEKMKIGGWIENSSGGFGVDSSIVEDVKKTLSTQQVSSHVSVLSMGAVPSIASSQLKLGVGQVIQPDRESISKMLALGQPNANDTVNSGADEALAGKRMLAIQSAKIQSVIQGLGKIDQGANKVMDVNSLMSAFENYLQAIQGTKTCIGVPINYYLKKISGASLARLWISKYFPNKKAASPTKG